MFSRRILSRCSGEGRRSAFVWETEKILAKTNECDIREATETEVERAKHKVHFSVCFSLPLSRPLFLFPLRQPSDMREKALAVTIGSRPIFSSSLLPSLATLFSLVRQSQRLQKLAAWRQPTLHCVQRSRLPSRSCERPRSPTANVNGAGRS